MTTLRRIALGMILLATSLAAVAGKIDINKADAETLAALNGVGPARAEAIIADREAQGPFRTVDDLVRVRGIGPAIVERNRPLIKVGEQDDEKRRRAAMP